jgi:hypothetical protein
MAEAHVEKTICLTGLVPTLITRAFTGECGVTFTVNI